MRFTEKDIQSEFDKRSKRVTQEDVDNQTQTILNEVHGHLELQDNKLNSIIERLEKLENEKQSREDEILYGR